MEEENPAPLTTLIKDLYIVWFWVFFAYHHHNSQHQIYWKNTNKYRTFQFWIKAHCISSAKSLDFVISGPVKKCKCINKLMLILCFQPGTLLKTRLQNVFLCNVPFSRGFPTIPNLLNFFQCSKSWNNDLKN